MGKVLSANRLWLFLAVFYMLMLSLSCLSKCTKTHYLFQIISWTCFLFFEYCHSQSLSQGAKTFLSFYAALKIKKKTYVMNKDFKNIPRARMISRRCTMCMSLPYAFTPPIPLLETTTPLMEVSIDGDNNAKSYQAGKQPTGISEYWVFSSNTKKKSFILLFYYFPLCFHSDQ